MRTTLVAKVGIVLTAVVAIFGSCSSSDSTEPHATGSLRITVAGLPAGVMARATVTGPGGFVQTATASRTFSNVLAGTYTITAYTVLQGGTAYSGLPSMQSIVVPASLTAQAVSVTYSAAATGSLQLTIAGLPKGMRGNVTITGNLSGTNLTATTSEAVDDLAPGIYLVTAYNVVRGSSNYAATPGMQYYDVFSSNSALAVVTYSIAPPDAGVWFHFVIDTEDYGVFTVSSSGAYVITANGGLQSVAAGSMSDSSFSGTLFLARPGSVQQNVIFSGTCQTMNYCSAKVGLGRGAYYQVTASR